MAPRQVIVKFTTVNKSVEEVFDFFSNAKNMEVGGALKSVTKVDDIWWEFDHITDGKGRMRVSPVSGFQNIRSRISRGGIRMQGICQRLPGHF